ncbi:MAG: hypothetical protein U0325_00890 [Polyangiales bacterium]
MRGVEVDVPAAAASLHVQVGRDEAALRGCDNVRLNTWGPIEGTLAFALTFAPGERRHPVTGVTRVDGTLTDEEPARCLEAWFGRQVCDLDPAVARATISLHFTMKAPVSAGLRP